MGPRPHFEYNNLQIGKGLGVYMQTVLGSFKVSSMRVIIITPEYSNYQKNSCITAVLVTGIITIG